MEEERTFISCLRHLVLEDPHRTYVIFVDKDLNQRVLTRQEVWDKSRRFAAVLKRLGLGKGDVICNTLVNSPERLITYLGTVASGATPSHGQLFLADGQDLRHNLKESKAKAIIYDPNDLNGTHRILDNIKFKAEIDGATRYKDLPDLAHVIKIEAKNVEETQRWVNVIDKEEEMFVEDNISKDDIAMIFVTSGTTGFSKLVPIKHHTLLPDTARFRRAGLCEDDIWFVMQSLGWGGGFVFSFLSVGCKRVIIDVTNGLPDDMPLGHFMVNIFNQTNVNKTFLIPRDIGLVLDACNDGLRINRLLDLVYTGGGPIYSATMDALGKIIHRIIVQYAGTEFPNVACNDIKQKSDFQDFCVGFPTSCTKVKIIGEDGKKLPPTEQGEILVRSKKVFTGYLNNPVKTAEMFTEDGWCKTGDIGYFNEDGKLFVLCRKADAITKDGFTHYPGWMEKLINKYPGLEKTVVVGIPDQVHQEEICLCMKPMPGVELSIDDVREFCKKLFLTSENNKMTPLPKYYLIFDDFITNENGKIQRKKMREEALKRLSMDES